MIIWFLFLLLDTTFTTIKALIIRSKVDVCHDFRCTLDKSICAVPNNNHNNNTHTEPTTSSLFKIPTPKCLDCTDIIINSRCRIYIVAYREFRLQYEKRQPRIDLYDDWKSSWSETNLLKAEDGYVILKPTRQTIGRLFVIHTPTIIVVKFLGGDSSSDYSRIITTPAPEEDTTPAPEADTTSGTGAGTNRDTTTNTVPSIITTPLTLSSSIKPTKSDASARYSNWGIRHSAHTQSSSMGLHRVNTSSYSAKVSSFGNLSWFGDISNSVATSDLLIGPSREYQVSMFYTWYSNPNSSHSPDNLSKMSTLSQNDRKPIRETLITMSSSTAMYPSTTMPPSTSIFSSTSVSSSVASTAIGVEPSHYDSMSYLSNAPNTTRVINSLHAIPTTAKTDASSKFADRHNVTENEKINDLSIITTIHNSILYNRNIDLKSQAKTTRSSELVALPTIPSFTISPNHRSNNFLSSENHNGSNAITSSVWKPMPREVIIDAGTTIVLVTVTVIFLMILTVVLLRHYGKTARRIAAHTAMSDRDSISPETPTESSDVSWTITSKPDRLSVGAVEIYEHLQSPYYKKK